VTGIGAPRSAPAEAAWLNAGINAAFADPRMPARLADTGCSLLPRTPPEFGRLFAAAIENRGAAHQGSRARGSANGAGDASESNEV
jgi:hypothetical protein